jgi:hypothetical protein
MPWSLLPPDALDIVARQNAKVIRAVNNGWPLKFYPDKPVKPTGKPLSPFDELAGRLMAEARPRRINRRLADAEYLAITTELDKAGFDPRKELQASFRKALKEWNGKNPRVAIKTFNAAFASRKQLSTGTTPRRGVQIRLDRAEAKWEESQDAS